MAPRFRSSGAAAAQAARRRVSSVLVVALLCAGLLLWKYSANFAGAAAGSGLAAQPKRHPQQSLLESLRLQLSSTGGGGGGGSASVAGDASAWQWPAGGRRSVAQQRITYEPIVAPDPAVVAERCGCTLGDWCGRYDAQKPIPAVPPPQYNKTCLWGCNFVGVCDHMKGWCRCPAGWTGDDCSTRMKRPCSQRSRSHGFEPYDEPIDPNGGAGTTLSCADLCDEDVAACYCNSTFKHGRVPADPMSPPGTPPKRHGRLIAHFCRSKEGGWGEIPAESLYGPNGWCEADEPQYRCGCIHDGMGGPTCETPVEPYCPNQCNGHGECRSGFCKCHEGWWGQDCAYRRPGTPWSPGMEDGERPWIKSHVHTPAARDPEPGATRRRPLIYVYELPPFYNVVMMQYRVDKHNCVHRLFDDRNGTEFNDMMHLYNPEPGLHEMLLQSEHRTLDPEEADYFYIPAYVSCFLYPVLSATDWPYFHGGPVAWRTHAAANMFIEVYHWVRSHYPYWDRNGGRDHIVGSFHDEGSCWVPAVLRPAIVLSHWGRTEFPHVSGTGFWPDNYTADTRHPVWQPEGHIHKLGDFPCFDPNKDLVLPVMHSAAKYSASPMLGAPALERRHLAFFKGRTQQENPAYSRGIRQTLENLTREHDWWGKHKIYVGQGMPEGASGSYSEMMAQSVFCFALMGDGFSSRTEDAVIHGCIPVLIQDGVEPTWSNLLDTQSYSVRILQRDMARVPEILKAVSQEDIARMQANLAKVWRRYLWSGFRPYTTQVRAMLAERREATRAAEVKSQPAPLTDYDPAQDDAFATLLQYLYARLDDLGAHAPARAGDAQRRRRRRRRRRGR